jgi:hypothetical protein
LPDVKRQSSESKAFAQTKADSRIGARRSPAWHIFCIIEHALRNFFPPAHDPSYGKNMGSGKMSKTAGEIAAPVRKKPEAVIAISSPVRGVRPIRALCATTLKLTEAGYGN